tara:strand:+ start:2418 stop:2765 length:348 start_codon:yes stop_codon:yes gene_type:complete
MDTGSINKVILIGHLGGDPDVRYTQTGIPTSSFSLATNEKKIDSNGNEQKKTEWHRIIAWNKTAEFCEQYLKKGQLIYLEGKIRSREYVDNDGNSKKIVEILSNHIIPLHWKSDK